MTSNLFYDFHSLKSLESLHGFPLSRAVQLTQSPSTSELLLSMRGFWKELDPCNELIDDLIKFPSDYRIIFTSAFDNDMIF